MLYINYIIFNNYNYTRIIFKNILKDERAFRNTYQNQKAQEQYWEQN